MKIAFFSDIHGVPSALEAALETAEALGYDRLVLLGDLLYHGPRNGVPDFYDPVKVAQILNGLKDRIIAVRGNCDAEVDQMMFEFPMMSDYAIVEAGRESFFCTHGHRWNEANLPPLGMGTVLVHGHTHIPEKKALGCGITIFNPGSVALPKGGSARMFGYFDGMDLRHVEVGVGASGHRAAESANASLAKRLKNLEAKIMADGVVDMEETGKLLRLARPLVGMSADFAAFKTELDTIRADGVIDPVESYRVANMLAALADKADSHPTTVCGACGRPVSSRSFSDGEASCPWCGAAVTEG